MDDRAALNGILFVLHAGIPWEDRRGVPLAVTVTGVR